MEAARHWASGGAKSEEASEGDDEWRGELRQLGVADGDIERALEGRDDHEEESDRDFFEVWPENAATVEIFLGLRTQWSVIAGMGGVHVQGLRYADVRADLRERRLKHRARVYQDLKLMEAAALEVMNRK